MCCIISTLSCDGHMNVNQTVHMNAPTTSKEQTATLPLPPVSWSAPRTRTELPTHHWGQRIGLVVSAEERVLGFTPTAVEDFATASTHGNVELEAHVRLRTSREGTDAWMRSDSARPRVPDYHTSGGTPPQQMTGKIIIRTKLWFFVDAFRGWCTYVLK
jgi:hypothetical protein